jgi:hypothetical protein
MYPSHQKEALCPGAGPEQHASNLLPSMLSAQPKDIAPLPAERLLMSSECGAMPSSEVESSAFLVVQECCSRSVSVMSLSKRDLSTSAQSAQSALGGGALSHLTITIFAAVYTYGAVHNCRHCTCQTWPTSNQHPAQCNASTDHIMPLRRQRTTLNLVPVQ